MIRVLHVLNRMHHGGAENMIMNIYRNIDRNEVQFDFLLHDKEPGVFDDEIKELGGNIYYVRPRNKGLFKNRKDLRFFFKMNSYKFSAVHQHVSSLSYLTPLLSAKKNGVENTIIHMHSTKEAGSSIHLLLHRLNRRRAIKDTNYFFSCSDLAEKWLLGKRKVDNSFIINNAVDLKIFGANSKKYISNLIDINDQTIVIGNVGRLVDAKNQSFLLEVFSKIVDKVSNSKLVIVGDGELYNELVAKSIILNIQDKVVFLKNRNDISKIMPGFDIFIMPSKYEGLPVTLVEAQASGIRCLISNSISEQVKITKMVQTFGLDKSADEWADEVFKILKVDYEKYDYIQDLKKAGFDIDHVVNQLMFFYKKERDN